MLKKAFITTIILLKCSAPVWAAASSSIVISELQTGSKTSASQEFVELYNMTESAVNLDDWTFEYKSATGTTWSKKAVLSGEIKPHGFYLLAPASYLSSADASFSAGLSQAAGHIRIKDAFGGVVDTLGWGETADSAETTPATKPAAGESLERLPGRLIEDGGNAVDADDNSKDFIIRTLPLPQSTLSAAEAPLTDVPEEDLPEAGSEGEEELPPLEEAPVYLPVIITELWIDPPNPLKDASDEFIEIYNPHDESVDLTGYVLKTGASLQDYYVIEGVVVAAQSYYVFYASETKLSLTNTGGQAVMLDPKGALVSSALAYSKTTPGYSWIQVADDWVWSLEPTPGAANVLVVPPPPPVKAAAEKPKPAAKPKTAKAAKPRAATAKKTSAAKPKATKKPAAPAAISPPKIAAVNTRHDAWLLIALVSLTIGYAIYELKSDLQNHYYLTRSKLRAWRENWPAASRRRND